jgi:hypothetical protein
MLNSALTNERFHIRPEEAMRRESGVTRGGDGSPPEVMCGSSIKIHWSVFCHDLTTALKDTDLNVKVGRRLWEGR